MQIRQFVARMERSGIREDKWLFQGLFPDSATLHPGYGNWFSGRFQVAELQKPELE